MRRLLIGGLAPILLAGLAWLALPQAGRAQTPQPVKANFDSADGVQLRGTFYPGPKGKDAPTVLLLHEIGKDRAKGGWDKLAVELQKKDFAVLSFDFRGHGDSTGIDASFWKNKTNFAQVKGGTGSKPKDTISVKDFARGYHTMLVNDIAAAKSFLDRRNDLAECNSANLIVIGAQDGATLGVLWMAMEQSRYRVINVLPFKMEKNPEGKDLAGALFLSVSSNIGGTAVSVSDYVELVAKEKEIPIGFLYGEQDKAAENVAKGLVKRVKPDKNSLTSERAVKGSQKLAGSDLLGKSIDTESLILKYLETVMAKHRVANYDTRKFDETPYVWSFPGKAVFTAKDKNEKTIQLLPLSHMGIR